jgi:hypothetical protein
MKFYRGSAAAARSYVESDHSRADDYYLTEGSGVATRYAVKVSGSVSPTVRHAGELNGRTYEQWVAGYDVETGKAKGRLRDDANALRFVEVTVNGPKTWSLAAALHPEVSAALDAAQGRAAEQIIAWVAAHATTRVGPRGRQVQVPVEQVEAAVIRHYTSRAGDPAATSTCRSTPGSSPSARGVACTRWEHGTSWRRSTGSDTPRSPPIPSSAGPWRSTA